MSQQAPTIDEEIHHCAVHTDVETELRCNRCERYMCAKCAVSTPVGYRCRECVRQVDNKFFTGTSSDYLIGGAICAVLGAVAGAIMNATGGFLFLAIILAFPVGGVVAEVALRAVKKRRGRYSGQIGAAMFIIGALIGVAIQLYGEYQEFYGSVNDFYMEIFGTSDEAEINRMLDQMPAAEASAIREMLAVPSAGDYIIEQLLSFNFSIGLYLFVGLAAFAVYSRMKL
ncbi:MAG: hypothetical protein SF029_18360 [bacterium]|nr:hypothetical protein [bacterium]